MTFEKITEKLKSQFNVDILEIINYRNELTFVVDKQKIVEICIFLKENGDLKFDLLVDICGLDMFQQKNRFEVVYNLWSLKNKVRIRLRVKVDEGDLHVLSVTPVWEAANFYERETYDNYGIIFDNHPDLRRIYMPDEFEYFPLRKDFPLMGIPDSLSLPRR
jgi:NADH-quinone oxidoreductase subunit C